MSFHRLQSRLILTGRLLTELGRSSTSGPGGTTYWPGGLSARENYGGVKYPDGEYLDMAVAYCGEHKLFFSGINVSKGETVGEYQLGSGRFGRKIVADVYIDDRSLPFSPNGFLSGLKWRIYLWMLGRRMRKMRIAKQG